MPPGRSVVSDGRRIAFDVRGTGPPTLILIHGWACHRGFWDRQTALLDSGTSVVTLDLAGHGASSTDDPARSIEAFARDVVAVVDALAHPEVILVGHSMGGPVAVEAAIRLAGRCRLVLGVDTFTDGAFYPRRPRVEVAARLAPYAADFAGTLAAMVRRITLCGGPDLATWIVAEMSRCDPATALAALEALLNWDIAARWSALPCAAETINSAILSRGLEATGGLDGLRVHLMDRVGHFPPLEEPAAFAALMEDIVRRHAGHRRS